MIIDVYGRVVKKMLIVFLELNVIVCSSTHTSAGCPAGQCCDRDYGGAEPGSCVGKGTIRNTGGKSYLCDPPFENLESTDSEEKNPSHMAKLKNLYSSVVNFLSHFFTQR